MDMRRFLEAMKEKEPVEEEPVGFCLGCNAPIFGLCYVWPNPNDPVESSLFCDDGCWNLWHLKNESLQIH